MRASRLFLTLGLLCSLILQPGFTGNAEVFRPGGFAPEIVVEGRAPVFGESMRTPVPAGMDEYYGIDYDCDGYGDSAVGSPFSVVSGQLSAGAVNVIYGTGKGLKKRAANKNGYTSLLIGVPGANVSGINNAGAMLSYKVSLNDYTKLTKPFTFHRNKLAGPLEDGGSFGLKLGYQVRF